MASSSFKSMAENAGPIRIVTLDIDQPIPELRTDSRHLQAYVLLSQAGVLRAEVLVDLTRQQSAIREQLNGAISRIQAATQGEPHRSAVADCDLPSISIVVPTIVSRVEELRRCVERFEEIDYPNFEVLLVDNRRAAPDPDYLSVLLRDHPRIRTAREPIPGISAARNRGIASAHNDIIAFTDDDVQVDPQWLRAIATRMIREKDLDAVTGLILPSELETPSQVWFERYFGGFNGERTFAPSTLQVEKRGTSQTRNSRVSVRDATGTVTKIFAIYGIGAYCAGANMAFRRSALERIGEFDLALGTGTPARGGEDLAAMVNILWSGGKIGFEPTAVVLHQHRREYQELLSLMDGNGIGFTAMLSSLIRNDPRHVIAIASNVPIALKQIAAQRARKIRGISPVVTAGSATEPSFPPELARREFRAYLRGPFAYWKSRRKVRQTAPS